VLLVAHRTPASRDRCERLAAAGADVFEVDVQLDHGRIAVSHFIPFGRTGRLQRDNWRFRRQRAALRDPDLADVVALVPPESIVLLDIKQPGAERRRELIDAMADTLADRDRYRVCGGQRPDLEQARAAGFATWRTVKTRPELAAVLDEGALADEAISIRHTLLSDDVVGRLHQSVPSVVAWTVNDLRRARELRRIGVDGLTTDRPAVLLDLSAGRAGNRRETPSTWQDGEKSGE
jgi:glycerophosphoryl diester phosphodiesterase